MMEKTNKETDNKRMRWRRNLKESKGNRLKKETNRSNKVNNRFWDNKAKKPRTDNNRRMWRQNKRNKEKELYWVFRAMMSQWTLV